MVSTPLPPAQIASKLALTAATIDTVPQGQVWVACVAGRITGRRGGGGGLEASTSEPRDNKAVGEKWANINLLKEWPLG